MMFDRPLKALAYGKTIPQGAPQVNKPTPLYRIVTRRYELVGHLRKTFNIKKNNHQPKELLVSRQNEKNNTTVNHCNNTKIATMKIGLDS